MEWFIGNIFIPVYLIGTLFNAILLTYIALFRKDHKNKILEISRLNIKDKTSFYFKKLPIIIFIYTLRIFGSWLTFKSFLNDLEKSQRYSLKEIKQIVINIVIFVTIIPTIGLFIYIFESFIEGIGMFKFMFIAVSIVLVTFILMLLVIKGRYYYKKIQGGRGVNSPPLKLHKIQIILK